MPHESFLPLRAKAFRGRPDAPAPPFAERAVVPPLPLGVARADDWLGGGLRGDGLHEFFAGAVEDMSATLGFALILALAARRTGQGPGQAGPNQTGPNQTGTAQAEAAGGRAGLLWLRRASCALPYGPGVADLGLDPGAVTILALAEERALLRAALDSVRAGAVGAVLLELAGRQPLLDLTATRRLVMSAASTGTLVLMVRSEGEEGLSAAHSRWQIRSAPSRPLAAGAPGHPVFDLTLLRQRSGREGLHILLEWNRDTISFREPGSCSEPAVRPDATPLSGGASAVAAGGTRSDAPSRAA